MTQPWMCPRCKRMNAPFNPTCFCKPEDDIELSVSSSDEPSEHVTDAARYLNPGDLYKILEAEKRKADIVNGVIPKFYKQQNICVICGIEHNSGQHCATLQNNLPPNGEFI